MSYASTYPSAFRADFRAAGVPQKLVGRLLTYLRNRRDYVELLDMPEHILKDLGLTRGEVRHAMRRPFSF